MKIFKMAHLSGRFYRIALLYFLYLPHRVLLYYYPTVFWSPNNCRFNLNRPKRNETFEFKVKPNSHLFFVCPNIAIWSDMSSRGPQHSMMFENLMLVDEDGFNTCSVNRGRNPKLNREILKCDDDPKKFKYTEEIFSYHRAFTDKMKYEYGKHYYFISTSDGSKGSLNNTNGGHCQTHHMKLKIYLCRKDEHCEFKMPKCPYTNVFEDMDKPTTSPKHSGTTATTEVISKLSTSLSTASGTMSGTSRGTRKGSRINAYESTKPSAGSDKKVRRSNLKVSSSSRTIWGQDKTHIIIHIVMALVLLVLVLCLIYVLVTRRKFKRKPVNGSEGINSMLYKQRPISLLPVDGDGRGPSQPAPV